MYQYPKLFIPGPTHVTDEILDAMAKPQIGHRTPEISDLIKDIVPKSVFSKKTEDEKDKMIEQKRIELNSLELYR